MYFGVDGGMIERWLIVPLSEAGGVSGPSPSDVDRERPGHRLAEEDRLHRADPQLDRLVLAGPERDRRRLELVLEELRLVVARRVSNDSGRLPALRTLRIVEALRRPLTSDGTRSASSWPNGRIVTIVSSTARSAGSCSLWTLAPIGQSPARASGAARRPDRDVELAGGRRGVRPAPAVRRRVSLREELQRGRASPSTRPGPGRRSRSCSGRRPSQGCAPRRRTTRRSPG